MVAATGQSAVIAARLGALAFALLASGAALADCKPLLDAMGKVALQTRFAAYDVDGPERAPAGEPDVVLIGSVGYVRTGTQWERVDVGDVAAMTRDHWHALRKEILSAKVRCTAAGTGTYRGVAVVKYHYESVDVKDRVGIVWIDRRSGLPVYEGSNDGSGGIAVMYGDAVKEPRVTR